MIKIKEQHSVNAQLQTGSAPSSLFCPSYGKILLRKQEVTHAAKKTKRYFSSASIRSPMPQKSKAIFQLRKPKVTHAAKK